MDDSMEEKINPHVSSICFFYALLIKKGAELALSNRLEVQRDFDFVTNHSATGL
jgi:hypothetical protein